MAYSDDEIDMIVEMVNEVNETNKKLYPNSLYGSSYRDVPIIKDILEIADAHTAPDEGLDSFTYYNWVAEHYEWMGRFSLATKYYAKAIESFCRFSEYYKAEEPDYFDDLGRKYDDYLDDIRSILVSVGKYRNCYYEIEDDCMDVIETASQVIPREEAEEAVNEGKKKVFIFHDPVETTDEYLDVIDSIEELIDEEFGNDYEHGMCFGISAMKKSLLAECNIEWRSEQDLNIGMWD